MRQTAERPFEPGALRSDPGSLRVLREPRAVRVAIVQDHDLAHEGVRRTLIDDRRFEVVGEAGTANEAVALLAWTRPDVVILDIRLRHGTGVGVCHELASNGIDTRVLVLTTANDDEFLSPLFALGVSGFLSKSASTGELKQSVLDLTVGRVVLSGTIADKLRQTMSGARDNDDCASNDRSSLTQREKEVLRQLGYGLRNAEMAQRMEISCRTVEVHVRNVLTKLGVSRRAQAVTVAIERGLL